MLVPKLHEHGECLRNLLLGSKYSYKTLSLIRLQRFFIWTAYFVMWSRSLLQNTNIYILDIAFILQWTTSLDTSSRTLFVREDLCRDVHVPSNVELRSNFRLLLNVELRNYVISRQIVI